MKTALIVLIILLGVVVAGALVAGPQLQQAMQSLKPTPPMTSVRVEAASQRKLIETVKAPGKIEARTKVDISSEVSSRIEQLPFGVGDTVKRGDIVVKLDDSDLKASLDAAKARAKGEESSLQAETARLTGLISSLTTARANFERQQALFTSGDLAQRDLDSALETVINAEAQVEAAKFSISMRENSLAAANFDVNQIERRLEKTVIRSPMDGVLTARNAEIGEVVLVGTMNNPGTVILKIADLSRMLVLAEIAESDISRVANGQGAKVHINAYRDEVFSGTVTLIGLERTVKADGSGYYEAEIEIDLRGKLIRTGGLANVDIEIESHDGLAIESQAVVDRKIDDLPEDVKRDNPLVDRTRTTASVVYRMVDGKAVCTPVRRGPSDDTHVQLLAGLNEGDVVVVGPYKVLEQIKHGQLIKVESSGTEAVGALAEQGGGGPRVRVRM